jgi:hypothetical protein
MHQPPNAADGLDLQLCKIGRCLAKCNGLIRGSEKELRKSMNQTAIDDEFYLTEGQTIYEFMLFLLRSTTQNLHLANIGNDLKHLIVSVSADCNDELLHEISKWLWWLVEKWNSQHEYSKLFRTRKGYTGISCKHAKPGDVVSILWGGRLPFRLRESRLLKTLDTSAIGSGDRSQEAVRYQLIGGYCYLHSMCDDEAVDIAERKGMREGSIPSNNFMKLTPTHAGSTGACS